MKYYVEIEIFLLKNIACFYVLILNKYLSDQSLRR